MSAFSLHHVTDVIDDERRTALSQLRLGITRDARSTLGIPLTVANLDESARQWFAPDPQLGSIKFQTYIEVGNYSESSVEELARKLTTISALSLLDPTTNRGLWRKQSREKLYAQRPIVRDILGIDRETFAGEKFVIGLKFDHSIVRPGKTRVPRWHRDTSSARYVGLTRYYTVRPNLMTETIREAGLNQNGEINELLQGYGRRHLDPPEVYAVWEAALKEQGLLYQPPANAVMLTTDETPHRSHQPIVPTPSDFLQISVAPIL